MPDLRSASSDDAEARFLRPARRRVARSYVHGGNARRRLIRRLGLVAAALGVLWLGRLALLRSPWLKVRRIEVAAGERVGRERLEETLAGLQGRSLLALDLQQVAARVEAASPWIESATIHRLPPDRLGIVIVERQAVARLEDGRGLLAADGTLLPTKPGRPADAQLPAVVARRGEKGSSPALLRTVSLLEVLGGGTQPLLERVAGIDASDPDDLVLRLTDAAWSIHIGGADFVRRLNRYLNAEPVLRVRYAQVATVDLRYRDRVVVAPVVATAGSRAAAAASGG